MTAATEQEVTAMTDAFITIFAAWAALAAAALSPGPNMVAVASRGLGSGKASALAVAFGISIGGFFWAVLTAMGLSALFQNFPGLLRVLGLIGGAYLAWLGFKGWKAALTGQGGELAPVAGRGLLSDMRYGLIVTATNPKVALLWASLSTFVSGATASVPMLLFFACGASVLLFAIYGGYGLLFSVGQIRGLYRRFQTASEAVFGTVFGVLGIGMILRSLRGA
jgi:threonine/homoserine/homoserine lactone efflux protein